MIFSDNTVRNSSFSKIYLRNLSFPQIYTLLDDYNPNVTTENVPRAELVLFYIDKGGRELDVIDQWYQVSYKTYNTSDSDMCQVMLELFKAKGVLDSNPFNKLGTVRGLGCMLGAEILYNIMFDGVFADAEFPGRFHEFSRDALTILKECLTGSPQSNPEHSLSVFQWLDTSIVSEYGYSASYVAVLFVCRN